MTTTRGPTEVRISRIGLVVADLERAVEFYRAGLGFALDRPPARDGGVEATVASLSLGGVELRLTQFDRPGAPYPATCAASDPWFQHFAIRVADMDAAYAHLSRTSQRPISTGGPQLLPPSTGSVTAYKFRDPDGHPLELSFVPGATSRTGPSPFVAIDHSAIAVADVEASIAFYARLGFVVAERLRNEGPTQWRLDGLEGALVDIVVLRPSGGGPHLELLHYRAPAPAPALPIGPHDVAATRLLLDRASFSGGEGALRSERDPDGHRIEIRSVGNEPGPGR